MMFEMNFWMEVLSWVGAISTLGSYYAITHEKICCKGLTYQSLTFVNNVFFVFYNIYKTSYSFAVLNFLFAIIALKYLIESLNLDFVKETKSKFSLGE
jgi:hypothetical protein